MNKYIVSALATLAVAGTAVGFTAGPSNATSVPTVKSTTPWTYQVKPSTILLAMADGNDRLVHLKWSAWSSDYARATGTRQLNSCKPDCAAGNTNSTRVTVFLDKNIGGHFTEVSFGSITNRPR